MIISRFRHDGNRMIRDHKGPWILVSVLNHYKRRIDTKIEQLVEERDHAQALAFSMCAHSKTTPGCGSCEQRNVIFAERKRADENEEALEILLGEHGAILAEVEQEREIIETYLARRCAEERERAELAESDANFWRGLAGALLRL